MRFAAALLLATLAHVTSADAADFVRGKAAHGAEAGTTRLRAPAPFPGAIPRIRLRPLAKSFAAVHGDDKRLRVGEARDVALESDGTAPVAPAAWTALASGAHVMRLSLVSPGAASLRLALRARGLGAGAEVRFLSPQEPDRVLGSVSGADISRTVLASGRYWTPVTEGDEQQVEVWLAPGVPTRGVSVEITAASHITVAPSHLMKSTGVGGSEACEEDVVCVAASNPALDRAARSVAKLLYTDSGVSYLCTGTLISDGDTGSQIPYLYTAAHCVGSSAVAATVNTFWFFQASACGGKTASDYKQLASGATLLYADPTSDAALLRLNEPAPDGAWFSGWSREPLDTNASVVALHHPKGDLQKLSAGRAMGPISNYNSAAWISGSTEGGSSGSGLFTLENGEYVLRGGLRGGSAACTSSGNLADPSNRDYYSRIDQASAQLDKWLSAPAAPLANYTGIWFEPAEPGWGLSVVQSTDNHVFATWYGYDAGRKPTWLVLPQATWTSATAFEGPLYRASGSFYGAPYDASSFTVSPVGTMRVEFMAGGTATLSATIDGTSFVRVIRPQPF